MRFLRLLAPLCGVLMICGVTTASATPLSASILASNGTGTFDPNGACIAGGAPSWQFDYSGRSATTSGGHQLDGIWSGHFGVSSSADGAGAGLLDGGSQVAVTVANGGEAGFAIGAGSCPSTNLALQGAVVSGTVPIVATGGAGPLRGLQGGGTVQTVLGVNPAIATNSAKLAMSGDFTVFQPLLSVSGANSSCNGGVALLACNLAVTYQITDATPDTSVGDAFAVNPVSATVDGGAKVVLTPSSPVNIASSDSSPFKLTVKNAVSLKTYTVKVTVASQDGLGNPLSNVLTFKVTAPLISL